MVIYKELTLESIPDELLLGFRHYQVIRESREVRQWSREKRLWIAGYLREQLLRGGAAEAAWEDGNLVGFGCVDGILRGESARYANLTMLFVDDTRKRQGIGTALFRKICTHAVRMQADKLFISAIPSADTLAFYGCLGCTDAREIIAEYVDTEQDQFLEYALTQMEK